MSRTSQAVGIGAVALGLMVGSAGVAVADDASFIADVRGNGIHTWLMNDSTLIGLGHIMCSSMRDGSSLDTVAAYPAGILVDGHGIAVAAQRELCPDTL